MRGPVFSLKIFRVPPARRYVEEIGLAVMLATNRSTDVTPEVNLRMCNMYASAKHE